MLQQHLVLMILSSVKDLQIGQTLFVRHSMMVVQKRSSVLVDQCIYFVHMLSLKTKRMQSRFVSTDLMMRPSNHSWSYMIKQMQTLRLQKMKHRIDPNTYMRSNWNNPAPVKYRRGNLENRISMTILWVYLIIYTAMFTRGLILFLNR